MAKIQHLLDEIRTAIYGKEVRGSLADGLEAINNETEDATEVAVNVEQRQDTVEQQFDDVLNEWTGDKPISNEETIAARTNRNTNENYGTIGQRLDAENNKVNAQLAGTKTEINNGLSTKVDKGGNEQVTMKMLAADIKQAINDGVWEVNVNTSDLEDKSVTSDKRTVLGSNATVFSNTSWDYPDIDEANRTVTFSMNSYIYWHNKRHGFDEDYIVNYADIWDNSSAGVLFVFDSDTKTIRTLASNEHQSINENELILMMIGNDGEGNIKEINANYPYTINGKNPITDDLKTYQKGLRYGLVSIGTETKLPNVDTDYSYIDITIYNNTWIIYNDETYQIPETKIQLKRNEGYTSVQSLVYNATDDSLRVVKLDEYSTITTEDIIIMTINMDNNLYASLYPELVNVEMMGAYTINGKNPYQLAITEPPHYFAPEPLSTNYQSSNDDYVPLGGDPEILHSKYKDLIDANPDYLSRTLHGKDQSDTHDIYTYRANVGSAEVRDGVLTKKKPKILLTVGVHGHEKSSIYGFYYFMKDLCENWQSNPILEYIRWNVELVFNPLVNPYGFSGVDSDKQRQNYRGVDLNRNSPVNWQPSDPSDWSYSGESAASEVETQYVMQMIDENTDAMFFGDFHTNGSTTDYTEYYRMFWIGLQSAGLVDENLSIAAKYTIEKITRELIKRYDLPSDKGWFGYITSEDHPGDIKSYAFAEKGIPSCVFECFMRIVGETSNFSQVTLQSATDYVGTFLASVINQFKNNQ